MRQEFVKAASALEAEKEASKRYRLRAKRKVDGLKKANQVLIDVLRDMKV